MYSVEDYRGLKIISVYGCRHVNQSRKLQFINHSEMLSVNWKCIVNIIAVVYFSRSVFMSKIPQNITEQMSH